MRTLLPLIVALSLLLSSCTSATQTVIPTTTPEIALALTSTATPTVTALPSITATPTLLPDPMIYQFDDNVSQADKELILLAVQTGRYYLLTNFGSDISSGIKIFINYDPNGDWIGELKTPLHETPFIIINTGHKFWKNETSARNAGGIIHELTHWWQYQHGCLNPETENYLTDFMLEGGAQYIGLMATGQKDAINSGGAIIAWYHNKFNETAWLSDSVVGPLAVKTLIDKYGEMSYTKWCGLVGQGKSAQNAFRSIFGIDVNDFRTEFKAQVLGSLKDCTEATCGHGHQPGISAHQDPKYGTLTPMIDYSLNSPNLIIKISDQNGKAIPNVNLQLFRRLYNDLYIGTGGEDNSTNSDGILSAPVLSGIYAMHFCESGYPIGRYSGDPVKCVYELNPFDVVSGQTTTIDFQYWDIQNHNLTEPNFLFTLLGVDGQPLGNQYVEVCGYDAKSTVCLNGKTDQSGLFRASLNAGKYFVRLVQPGQGSMDPRGYSDPEKGMNLNPYQARPEYEIRDINIESTGVKSLVYQFPTPNLQIEFLDVNGSPVPNVYFYLCKSSAGSLSPQDSQEKAMTDKILSMFYSDWDTWTVKVGTLDGNCFLIDHTDKQGVFKIHVDLGNYFVYFDNPGSQLYEYHFDHMLSDINVTGDQLTTVSYQFK